MSDEAAVAHLTPGPKHRQMGLAGEWPPQRRSVQLNSVEVAQLSAVFCWGKQMCFVEPCSVDSGRTQTLEFPLGLWILAPKEGHGWLLGVCPAVKLAWEDVLLSAEFEQHLLFIFGVGLWVGHFLIP